MGLFDIDNKLDKIIDISYVIEKGFTWNRGVVPPEECGGQPFGPRLLKYDYDINAIIKYFPNTQQLHIHGPNYSWAKYVKVNNEYEFDTTYLYLIQLYKDHEHI